MAFSIMALVIAEEETIEISLSGDTTATIQDRIQQYMTVLEDLSIRQHIKFALKAGSDAYLLLSEKEAYNIDTNTDNDYVIGMWGNVRSIIRVGSFSTVIGMVLTADILDPSTFKEFCLSWNGGIVKVGRGFGVNEDIIMQNSYPDLPHFIILPVCSYS